MSNRSMLNMLFVASLVAGSAMSLSAQSVVTTDAAVVPVAVTTTVVAEPVATEGARLVRSGVSRQEAATAPAPQLMQGADRRNVAWMVVGLAALGVGILVGGDVGSLVAVTGGVIGLVGLFRYMN